MNIYGSGDRHRSFQGGMRPPNLKGLPEWVFVQNGPTSDMFIIF